METDKSPSHALDEYKTGMARALDNYRLLTKLETPGARDVYIRESKNENPSLSTEEAEVGFAAALDSARWNRDSALVIYGPAYMDALNEDEAL